MTKGSGHVDARPLAAKGKPGADCERAANEFHRNDAKRRLPQLLIEDGFDMRDAASSRLGRDPANERSRDSRSRPASGDQQPDALGPLGMREGDKRIAQLIRLFEQKHETGDPSAGDRAHDQRENRQEREAPALPFAIAPSLQFRNHALRRFRLPEGESERVRNRRPRLLRLGAFISWPAALRSIRNGMFEPIPDRAGAWALPERLFRTAVVGAAENPHGALR
jgi:hypothetical protein